MPRNLLVDGAAERARRTAAARWSAIALAEVNVGIHTALTPMHLDEKFYIGVLFCLGSALLTAAALLLATRNLRPAGWLFGAVVSIGMFGGFVASRTVGLPLGYHETWAAAPEDLLGLVSLGTEVGFVLCAAFALRRPARSLRSPTRAEVRAAA